MIKVDRPRKTRSGWVHQTSGRMVWPNARRGMVSSVEFIGPLRVCLGLDTDAQPTFQLNLAPTTVIEAFLLLKEGDFSQAMPFHVKRQPSAFTLVEIMIVVSIITLLAMITVPGFLR